MKIALVIFNVLLFMQAGPCGDGRPNPPCCNNTPPCGGGPPSPPGLDIDTYIYFLFFTAIVYGVYVINKRNKKVLPS